MSDPRDDPSLLRFVLERLDEEEQEIIWNTPLRDEEEMNPEFLGRFVGRRALIQRSRLTREIVASCVESMRRVQGPPRAATPVAPPDEATVLGSDVVKLVASGLDWHPDYQSHWRPRS